MSDYSTITAAMQDKRIRADILALVYRDLGHDARADAVAQCGTYLGLYQPPEGGGCRIVEANFCRDRLCPCCNWRRSVRIYAATSRILDWIDATYPRRYKYLFLTLTVRNVRGEQLSAMLDQMAAGIKRLTNNRAWTRRVHGMMRTTEVTINHEDQTYHPHYHLILCVDRTYATRGDATYWDQAEWTRQWAQACRLDYTPMVWIERVKGRRSGIAEVSKYMAKDTDYIRPDDMPETTRVVSDLMQHLAGRRLVSYTGVLREAQRALRVQDPETADLTDAADIRGDISAAIKRYHWSAGCGCYLPHHDGVYQQPRK